jgi:uncharacterized protein YifN (PemK superfamily)
MSQQAKKIIPKYVRKSKVFMCDFEMCCRKSDGMLLHCDFTSNIKPEIGKIRPVAIIKPHKRHKLAIIVPFTTQKPVKEINYALHIPVDVMPGILGCKECWAICDMIQVVSLNRLDSVLYGNRHSHTNLKNNFLPKEYFSEIISRIHKLTGE